MYNVLYVTKFFVCKEVSMTPELNIDVIKRKIYYSYFQDGLWDIVLGLFLLSWGCAVLLDLTWMPGAAFVAFFWLALGLKRKITYPRAGYAITTGMQRQRIRILIAGIATFILGLFILGMVVTGFMPNFMYDYFELFFGIMIAILTGLIGLFWGITRWYIYAGAIGIFAAINQWSTLTFDQAFFIPGGIISICGIIILIRFLKKYSNLPQEDSDDNR